jgi:hypothetical protein
MDGAEVSGRQSQLPPSSKYTNARTRGIDRARAPAASRYQARLWPRSARSSTVPVSATISGFPVADPQA